MTWRVFAIRYAHRASARRAEAFCGGDPHDGPMPMDYFLWAVVGPVGAVVVDAGFTADAARRRPGRELIGDPMATLAALGADPATVPDVVLTHLHYDHVGHVDAFGAARFWVQDAEMAFWTGRHASRPSFRHVVDPGDVARLVSLNFDGRLRFVDGDATVAPGISVHHVGGHTAGLQVVRVESAAGPVVLASDASHYYENLDADRPFSIVTSLPEMHRAFDRLRELAGPDGVIVPGHDPLVLDRHPVAGPGLEGVAVEIVAGAGVGDAGVR